jgi:multimeric flavodoxin WrbA
MQNRITAIYASPRRDGNTATLLRAAVAGARDVGAVVDEFVLRDLTISPCLEIYGCRTTGRCVIRDDFNRLLDQILESRGVMFASPIFFYAVSAHAKAFMDRCQSRWIKKYWLSQPADPNTRKGLFIAVGATRGKRLFDGALLSVRYCFDALDISLWQSLLYRGIDQQGDIDQHPAHIAEAHTAGRALAEAITM